MLSVQHEKGDYESFYSDNNVIKLQKLSFIHIGYTQQTIFIFLVIYVDHSLRWSDYI